MLKAVIFDMDGTVCDSLPLCVAAFRAAIEPLAGRAFTDKEIMATFGPSEEGTVMALSPRRFHEGLQAYWRHYERLHHMCPAPFPGVRELLDELRRRKIIVAMVTGKGMTSCLISLKRFGLERFFDMIETGSPQGPRKPAGIRSVLDRFRLAGDEAVYVGDSPSDVDAAREAGVPVVSAMWAGSADRDEIAARRPDMMCHSVAELAAWLDERA